MEQTPRRANGEGESSSQTVGPKPESAFIGTLLTFGSEALMAPSGLLVTVLLTRQLSLAGYGRFILVVSLVTWVEWTIVPLFSRSTVKLLSETDDWRLPGATIFRTHAATSLIAMLILMASAGYIAFWLGEPRLAAPLRVFSLDVPLFCMAQAHRSILVGLRRYRARALASALRWITRPLLIALFVWRGWDVTGALLGAIGASGLELLLCRQMIKLPWRYSGFSSRALWQIALPMLGCTLTLRVLDNIDLFALKSLGASASQAALYGAAQNLALVPGLFSLAYAPVVVGAVARARRAGEAQQARHTGREALRAALLMGPLIALVASAASGLMALLFGAKFASAGPVLSLLIWAEMALALVSVCTSLLVAYDRPGWPFALIAPLLPLALFAHWMVTSAFGMMGAASVTASLALGGAFACLIAVGKLCQVPFPCLRQSGL